MLVSAYAYIVCGILAAFTTLESICKTHSMNDVGLERKSSSPSELKLFFSGLHN